MNETKQVKDLLDTPIARRRFLSGGATVAAVSFLGGGVMSSCGKDDDDKRNPPEDNPDLGLGGGEQPDPTGPNPTPKEPLLGFNRIDPVLDETFDWMAVPEGYNAQVFFSWGDPVVAGAPSMLESTQHTAADQEKQAGQNHDGMHYFPIDGSSEHGLLVMNHEYINQWSLHPAGDTLVNGVRPQEEVLKELAAHGVSVLEVKKNGKDWSIVSDSKYGRRIHGQTKMMITGPAAGTDALKTVADPEGRTVYGTYNNCAMGYTPWGTYLACEENFQGYFGNKDETDFESRREHKRYGIGTKNRYDWDTVMERFDATPKANLDHQGYVNEPNRFGWVVEIDPFDPKSDPVKRTAMGRLVRECATPSVMDDGKMAFYMGDDSRGEYIYKFVPKGTYDPKKSSKENGALLDEGTLYVAVFYEDGTGEWAALEHGKNGLTALNGFRDQADIVINARSAADHVGATPMDRPEWVAIHPESKDVYVTLTNNSRRGNGDARQTVNAANPREANLHGHIVKIAEANNRADAVSFEWDIFLMAGDPSAENETLKGDIKGDIFSSPDGLYFDQDGRLWIQTDYSDSSDNNVNFGLNQMLASDPETKEVRRFFVGPKGCEVTGITKTPDGTSMFINVQHPKLHFPDRSGKNPPRSSTILIQKDDGGIVGA
ncbi:PhoX family protein [Pseudobacteriovorax antillogorgiicola]|uniref:Uncharacterized protein n=1 Tax=Pseudobacteriovorax antillogorgiicola TaxID=1513793 RepID=A0A1Y6CFF5_9BACT|nr:PhoX family phosphatase [Pseudobacteriovorax antillogorgiicola]TCS48003.1 hypothetical protein EDD56_119114 [Pseudobacteriovorax antillogorgiicola]SMF58523.1 hypothetical protein SAMN06296036_119115 [Pseudobacteriovorax antillogorgiicola]